MSRQLQAQGWDEAARVDRGIWEGLGGRSGSAHDRREERQPGDGERQRSAGAGREEEEAELGGSWLRTGEAGLAGEVTRHGFVVIPGPKLQGRASSTGYQGELPPQFGAAAYAWVELHQGGLVHMRVCVCAHARVCVCAHARVCVCVCVCTCMCVCTCQSPPQFGSDLSS